MRKGTRTSALPALLFISLTSCYLPRYIYAPRDVNVPLLKGKNDVQAAGLYAGDGAEVHAAYAPAAHLGLLLNGGFRNPRDYEQTSPGVCRYCTPFFDTSVVRYHRVFLDAGAGYFNKFPFSRRLGYAVYGGGGPGVFSIREHGSYRDTSLPYSRRLRARSTDLFIQPSVSLTGGWVDVVLAYRLFWIRYSHDRSTYTPQETAFYHLGALGRGWLYFTEPALVLRVHDPALPWLMLELQEVSSVNRSGTDFDYRPGTGGIGVVVDLARLGKGRAAGKGRKAP